MVTLTYKDLAAITGALFLATEEQHNPISEHISTHG